MFKIAIAPHTEAENHQCETYREGDWIIFRCPRCRDFERRYNWRTGAMKSRHTNSAVFHSGSHFPQEFGTAYTDIN